LLLPPIAYIENHVLAKYRKSALMGYGFLDLPLSDSGMSAVFVSLETESSVDIAPVFVD
jgi:hypothetical protein